MIVVWGRRYSFEPIDLVDTECPECGKKPCTLEWAHKKGHVYWIPLFNMATSYTLYCDHCKEHWHIDKAEGQRLQFNLRSGRPGAPVKGATFGQHSGPSAPDPPAVPRPPARIAPILATVATCAGCGTGLPEGARFCQQCGTAVVRPAPAEACPSCGNRQSSGKFCASCGAAMPV